MSEKRRNNGFRSVSSRSLNSCERVWGFWILCTPSPRKWVIGFDGTCLENCDDTERAARPNRTIAELDRGEGGRNIALVSPGWTENNRGKRGGSKDLKKVKLGSIPDFLYVTLTQLYERFGKTNPGETVEDFIVRVLELGLRQVRKELEQKERGETKGGREKSV